MLSKNKIRKIIAEEIETFKKDNLFEQDWGAAIGDNFVPRDAPDDYQTVSQSVQQYYNEHTAAEIGRIFLDQVGLIPVAGDILDFSADISSSLYYSLRGDKGQAGFYLGMAMTPQIFETLSSAGKKLFNALKRGDDKAVEVVMHHVEEGLRLGKSQRSKVSRALGHAQKSTIEDIQDNAGWILKYSTGIWRDVPADIAEQLAELRKKISLAKKEIGAGIALLPEGSAVRLNLKESYKAYSKIDDQLATQVWFGAARKQVKNPGALKKLITFRGLPWSQKAKKAILGILVYRLGKKVLNYFQDRSELIPYDEIFSEEGESEALRILADEGVTKAQIEEFLEGMGKEDSGLTLSDDLEITW